jgi:hypothetical protein
MMIHGYCQKGKRGIAAVSTINLYVEGDGFGLHTFSTLPDALSLGWTGMSAKTKGGGIQEKEISAVGYREFAVSVFERLQ